MEGNQANVWIQRSARLQSTERCVPAWALHKILAASQFPPELGRRCWWDKVILVPFPSAVEAPHTRRRNEETKAASVSILLSRRTGKWLLWSKRRSWWGWRGGPSHVPPWLSNVLEVEQNYKITIIQSHYIGCIFHSRIQCKNLFWQTKQKLW